MERTRLTTGRHPIVLLGVCQGLEGEDQAVRDAIYELDPATVALAVDPELASQVHKLAPSLDLGVEDEAYSRGLSRWGEVALPPPEYPAAIEAAEAIGAGIEGVDLPEEDYLNRFTSRIGVLDLTKRALKVRWLKTRPPKAEDPSAYCRRFDEQVNKGPFGQLEHERERKIADRLLELADEGSVACVIEIPRADGVHRVLEGHAAPSR